jgi:hypothetical protein
VRSGQFFFPTLIEDRPYSATKGQTQSNNSGSWKTFCNDRKEMKVTDGLYLTRASGRAMPARKEESGRRVRVAHALLMFERRGNAVHALNVNLEATCSNEI